MDQSIPHSMGQVFSNLYSLFQREIQVVMVGLDGAGKTTILNKLNNREITPTIPHRRPCIETLYINNFKFKVLCIGIQDRIYRKILRYYYEVAATIIFVIDGSDRDRIDEVKEVFYQALEDENLKQAAFLIFANKQDLPNAMSTAALTEKLGLHKSKIKQQWMIIPCSAIKGEGLRQGFDWLAAVNSN